MKNFKSVNLSDEQLLSYSKGKVYNYRDISLKGSDPTPVMGGLYDRRIFGSERYCNCGRSFSSGHVCPVCAVHIEPESELKKRFGHIELNYPYVSPFQLPTFIKLANRVFKDQFAELHMRLSAIGSINSLMSAISKLVFITRESDVETQFKAGSQYFEVVVERADEDSNFNLMGLHGLKSTLSAFDLSGDLLELHSMIHNILLISPAVVRKFNITNVSGKPIVHIPQATIDYQAIIYANNIINEVISNLDNNYDKISRVAGLALLVDAYLSKNQLTASSKQSFVRQGASTRAFESGRATIVSDFDLEITQVSIPGKLLYHSISYEIIEGMRSISQNPEVDYRDMTQLAMDTFYSIIAHSCAIVVRNPSLHKYNVTAFRIVPSDKDVIGLPPLVCQGYNADRLSLFA